MTQTFASQTITAPLVEPDSGMSQLLDQLSDLLVAETKFVRAGKFKESSDLQTNKMQLITRFQDAIAKVGESERDTLSHTLKKFHTLLEDNLKALEIARDISGKIIKKVSDTINGPRKTSAYGANGQIPTCSGTVQRGIAIDKGY